VNTQKTETDLEKLIARASARVDGILGIQTPGDERVKDLISLMVAVRIIQCDPSSYSISGGYSETARDPTAEWKKEIEDIIEEISDAASEVNEAYETVKSYATQRIAQNWDEDADSSRVDYS
jgi:hypothetical protein